MRALLCLVVCATIFGCLRYYVECATLVRTLVYCNFHKEVRLGGWGTEGPKAPTLGRHVSACATILRLRALLYLCESH